MNALELARFLPPDRFGAIREVTPLVAGLSGADVDAVTTDSGEYVVRRVRQPLPDNWQHAFRIHRLVAAHDIAPPLELVDDAEAVTVSRRISAPSAAGAFGDPASRPRVLASLVEVLAKLHALPGDGVNDADPTGFAREIWDRESVRPGFPAWALPLADHFAACDRLLAADPRRVLSHNDTNPGNVLWDGERVWLVDWDVSAMSHPYYDLATISAFVNLSDEQGLALLAAQERSPISAEQAGTYRALRRLATIMCGAMFMRLTKDLESVVPRSVADAPTLPQFYAMLASGAVDLRSDAGQAAFGSALLRQALG